MRCQIPYCVDGWIQTAWMSSHVVTAVRSWRLLAAVARLVPVNKSAALLIILLLIMENCGALVLIWPFACPGQLQQVKDGAYHGSAAASAAGGGGDNMLYFQQYNCQ